MYICELEAVESRIWSSEEKAAGRTQGKKFDMV